MKKVFFIALCILILTAAVFAQLTLPRESQRQEIAQTVGDTKISIVYHRPNVKARKIWGCQTNDFLPKGGVTYPCLVPYGQVWRTGANENTTFEVTNDVIVNGKKLPAGKYGLHTVPNPNDWTIIFSKVNDAWGSFTYDQKNDALRVSAKPQTGAFQETMSINFDGVLPTATQVVIAWENVRVPFTVDAGDVSARTLTQIREAIKNRKADDTRPLNQGAGYVLSLKLKDNYAEALGWLDESLKTRETFGTLNTKARLSAEAGQKQDAIATAEKAIQVGKAATPAADTSDLEKLLAKWKSGM
ncbi:MAG: DUF2911 domain-containing protein [Pyrinomonadaceae bacterium]